MDTTKANPFEKNGKHLGKLTRQPQKYETTLLGRQRTGSRLTCLRRGGNTASQLKRHGKHIGKPTRKPKNTKQTCTSRPRPLASRFPLLAGLVCRWHWCICILRRHILNAADSSLHREAGARLHFPACAFKNHIEASIAFYHVVPFEKLPYIYIYSTIGKQHGTHTHTLSKQNAM